jgi:mannan endo-1,4-beta-mannosidase
VRTKHLIASAVMISLAVVEFSVFRDLDLQAGRLGGPAAAGAAAVPSASAPPPPAFDVSHLLDPSGKYFGVALGGSPTAPENVAAYTEETGKKPNMLTVFESFDDEFAASQAREAYQGGALPVVRWEPFKPKLKEIAAGEQDAYVTRFATAVRATNVPVVMTFGHEMNGGWYSWGSAHNKAADFVAAWRHIHGLFEKADATNVIWAWTPNVINPVPGVKLKPLYPGDKYVDWIGVDGYFTRKGRHTYDSLFGPTKRQVRDFTDKPFLIVETGAEPGESRPQWIRELTDGVEEDDDMLGFVYFNQNGSARWKIDDDSDAIRALRKGGAAKAFGFTVR